MHCEIVNESVLVSDLRKSEILAARNNKSREGTLGETNHRDSVQIVSV